MQKSYAKNWSENSPTPGQIAELFLQIQRGQITRNKVQGLLRSGGLLKPVGQIEVTNRWPADFKPRNVYDVPIIYVHEEFKKRFAEPFNPSSKSRVVQIYDLVENAENLSILTCAGENSLMELAFVWNILCDHFPFLHRDGKNNIFYLLDSDRNYCSVNIWWNMAGWNVGTSSLWDSPREGGARIFVAVD